MSNEQPSVLPRVAGLAGCVGAVVGGVLARRNQKAVVLSAAWFACNFAAISVLFTGVRRFALGMKGVTDVEASIAAGSITGLAFGISVAKQPHTAFAWSAGGGFASVAGEVLRTEYRNFRLRKLLAEKHPELAPQATSASTPQDGGPTQLPKWLPVRRMDDTDELYKLTRRVEALQWELAELDKQIAEASQPAAAAAS
eukprot:m.129287 g.129287  ORF g.129287 m.129287 type:complete len:198 (-) comp16403_c1_seq3:2646-3239(-)